MGLSKRSFCARSVALVVVAAFVLASCAAQQVEPATVHLSANANQLEHDEMISKEGVTEFYPNKAAARETVFKGADGSLFDGTCLDRECTTVRVKVKHSPVYPDGTFQILQTDDPNVVMFRDANGDKILGYAARDHSGNWKALPDLQQAREYEHKGETARAVGKVVVTTLLVGALLALVGAAAIADAKAKNP